MKRAALTLSFVLLAAWEGAVRAFHIPAYLLPPPSRVFVVLFTAFPELWPHWKVTFLETLVGWVVGGGVGFVLGVAMYARRVLKEMLMPWVVASQAIPVFALAPLLVLWFGYGLGSKVAMSLLITFFPVTLATLSGLSGYEDARALLRAYRIPAHVIFFRVTLPGALPDILTGWKVSAGVAPIAAVIGEWVGAERGLGYVMLRYNAQLRVDRMFAALILLAVLGLGLTWLVEQIERRWVFWRGLEHSC